MPLTACVEVREEGNPAARNSCHYHWASNAPTVRAILIRGLAWTLIADTARRLGHRGRSQELQVHVIDRTR